MGGGVNLGGVGGALLPLRQGSSSARPPPLRHFHFATLVCVFCRGGLAGPFGDEAGLGTPASVWDGALASASAASGASGVGRAAAVSRRSAALGSAQAPAREPSPLIAAPLAAPHCRTTDPPPLWTATLKKPRDVLASTQKKYPTEIASIRHACVQTTFSRSQLQHPLWRVAEPPSHARVLLHNRKGFGSTVSVSPLGFPTPPPASSRGRGR